MGGLPDCFRLEIPECAVERIARGAGRHRALQSRAVEAARERLAHRPERCGHAFHRLAVARVRHALAAPGDRYLPVQVDAVRSSDTPTLHYVVRASRC